MKNENHAGSGTVNGPETAEAARNEMQERFLSGMTRIRGNAVLMRRHEDGRLECLFASEQFARMMECTAEEAVRLMDGLGFFHTTHPEDRPFVRSMLRRRV